VHRFAAMFFVAAAGLVTLAGAAATPSERFIAYAVEYQPGQIWRAELDGTGARKLKAGETVGVSPDGAHIAFMLDARLYVMNADGSGTVSLHNFRTVNSGRYAPRLTWAPDSRRLAVQDSDGPIWLVDTRTRSARRLVHRVQDCCLAFTDFAPRGCQLVYVVEVTTQSDPFRVRTVRCDGSHGRTVGTTFGGAVWGNAGIAVTTRAGLRIILPDGRLRQLPIAKGSPIAFSGDGRVLLAEAGNGLAAIDVATGRVRRVARPTGLDTLDTKTMLSHDGSSILAILGCVQSGAPSGTLEVISVETGATTVIVEDHYLQGGAYGPCRASWNA
jgi:Tol biopolymer transport system component